MERDYTISCVGQHIHMVNRRQTDEKVSDILHKLCDDLLDQMDFQQITITITRKGDN